MNKTISLSKLYVNTVYGLSGLFQGIRTNRKAALKLCGVILLVLYMLGSIGVVFVSMAAAQYDALKPIGLEWLLPMNGIVSAVALTLLFGFITALSTYYVSGNELILLSFPLKPRELFVPKFVMTFLAEVLLSSLIILIYVVIFGIREHPPLPFYIYSVVIMVSIPIIPLSVAYLVLVPLLSFSRFMKNKDAMMLFGTGIAIAFAIGLNLLIQRMMPNLGDAAWVVNNLGNPDGIVNRFGLAYPPSLLAADALRYSSSLRGLASVIGLVALSFAILAVTVAVMSRPYAKSLLGFNEVHLKKLDHAAVFIQRSFTRKSALVSSLLREIRSMNREPIYLLNGPLMIVIGPIILGVLLIAQRQSFLGPLTAFFALPDAGHYLALIGAGLGAFLGSSTSIAATAVSREGAQLFFLRSLPLAPEAFFGGKLLHALAFALAGSVIGVLCVTLLGPVPLTALIAAVAAAFFVSALINVAGLFVDTANPRLTWTNPASALKQNPNTVIIMFGAFGILGLLGWLLATLPASPWNLPVTALAAALLSGGAYAAFMPFARRKYYRVEV